MASRAFATSALLITLNLLFFTMVTSTSVPCGCSPSPTIHKPPPSHPKSSPPPHPKSPPPPKPKSPPPTPTKEACPPPPSTPKSPPSPTKETCPINTLKLGVCGNLLNDLVHIVIGTTPSSKTQCCNLLGGLTDMDAAVCLCTAIKANALGINLNVPVSLSILLNYCGKELPSGFQCA